MKTAIVGAGRTRNGIGPYIARYFQKNGARVVSVLGAGLESARKAAAALIPYGVDATPYADFDAMMQKDKPEAIVIASPAETHQWYLTKAVAAGLHVFCEKPFVWQASNGNLVDLSASLDSMFAVADQKRLKIAMNSQWPFSLQYYETLCGPLDPASCQKFDIRLSPVVQGREMILDSMPHALSMLYTVLGPGTMDALQIKAETRKMAIELVYLHSGGACRVTVDLVHSSHQPREFSYGFNQKIVRRLLELSTYDISFAYGGRALNIEDPLDLSVRDFLQAVAADREPFIGRYHILNNINLLQKIYEFSKTI